MTMPLLLSELHFNYSCMENAASDLLKKATIHYAASSGDKSSLKKITDVEPPETLEVKDCFGRTPLVCSVIYNQVECVSLLLKTGARVNNSDNSGQTALHLAVSKGHHRCVKLLLSHGAIWHQKDLEGVSALHLSAIHKSLKCLALIMKEMNPGEIDMQDSSKKTALHWSAAYTNVEHIRLLLSQDANICIPDMEGKTPLHWAATSSDFRALECVKILLEKESSVINWQDYEGRSALHLAVASGTTETVEYLTSRENCDINILDNMFCTPLHWAAKLGLSDKAGLLLDRGAAYVCADGNGATPLHYAAHHNHADTMKVFLSRSYVTDEPDCDGRSALIWAAARKADNVVKLMAEEKGNLSFGDKNGSTAFHAAAIQGHISTIKLLYELRATIDIVDKAGMTPLLRACEMGRAKAAQVLIDCGASLSARDMDLRTCLHWAAQGGHAYLCQVLLQYHCLLDSQDVFGMTALHYASSKGCINCVSVLLESMASTDISDQEGKTPLHWAVLNDHLDVSRLLCEYGASINAMALLDGWVTPLDCAINSDHVDIVEYLYNLGALKSIQIESIAARKIQKWFRTHLLVKRSFCQSSSCDFSLEKQSFVNNTTNKSLSEIICPGKASLRHIQQGSSENEEFISSKKSALYDVFDKTLVPPSENFSKDSSFHSGEKSKQMSSSRIPVAIWRIKNDYLSARKFDAREEQYKKYFCSVCNKCDIKVLSIEENAAITVQKAWRRFSMKNKFRRIRKKVRAAFQNEGARRAAEDDWQKRITHFFSQM